MSDFCNISNLCNLIKVRADVRTNYGQFMKKNLKKAGMYRTKLRNIFLRNRSDEK